jgi:hypothetical protein
MLFFSLDLVLPVLGKRCSEELLRQFWEFEKAAPVAGLRRFTSADRPVLQ